MKAYKSFVFFMSLFIEILAIVFFLVKKMEPLPFFLIVMSQAMISGLYFLDRHKLKQQA